MKYQCGQLVLLGDEIMVQYGPNQKSMARVVAIGFNDTSDDIDQSFFSWAKDTGIITDETVVVQWIDQNPLSHHDPKYAPVGNYMTLQSVCCEQLIRRMVQKNN
jgi:hypothetical protein